MKILSSIRYLACQRLPLRSHNDSESNFRQLDDPNFQEWLHKETNRFTSSAIQDEILKDMVTHIGSKMWCFSQYYSNYEEVRELLKWCLKEYKHTETKARIIGVQTQMNKLNYFFGVKLAILLLRHSDNLSATLQSPNSLPVKLNQ